MVGLHTCAAGQGQETEPVKPLLLGLTGSENVAMLDLRAKVYLLMSPKVLPVKKFLANFTLDKLAPFPSPILADIEGSIAVSCDEARKYVVQDGQVLASGGVISPIWIWVALTNTGKMGAYGFKSRINLTANDIVVLNESVELGLAPGQCWNREPIILSLPDLLYKIHVEVTADVENDVNESDELNNTIEFSFEVHNVH